MSSSFLEHGGGGLFLCPFILSVVGLLLIISTPISLYFYGVIEFVSSSLIRVSRYFVAKGFMTIYSSSFAIAMGGVTQNWANLVKLQPLELQRILPRIFLLCLEFVP